MRGDEGIDELVGLRDQKNQLEIEKKSDNKISTNFRRRKLET